LTFGHSVLRVNVAYTCRCGVCDGNGRYIDVLHDCCAGVLDAAGICCESGVLDDCGVCDGDHSTCNKALSLSLMLPAVEEALQLSDPGVDTALRYDFRRYLPAFCLLGASVLDVSFWESYLVHMPYCTFLQKLA
jgi:hypothetical protein